MRTDVKIGLAAGLLLVIAFVTYHAVFTDDAADPNDPGQRVAGTDGAGGGAGADGRGGASDGVALPRFGGISGRSMTATPAGADTPGGMDAANTSTISAPPVPSVVGGPPPTPEPVVTPVISAAPTTPEPIVTPVISAAPPTPEPVVTPVIGAAPPAPEPVVIPAVAPDESTITPVEPGMTGAAAAGEQTYTVKEGDAGFWAIAAKVYGDGRLWTLIAKANPGADSNRLPPGKRLRIPPRPVTRPNETGSEGAGGLIVTPDGGKQYVVKKGDAGFWGIAQVVYGNGKHWTLIAKANPSFNSTGLKAGDRLIIPPRPTAVTTPVAPVPTIIPGPGEKVYVVQKSDSAGFWGIAKKVYGDGLYWQVIAKANPSADSSSLKEGQKLIIPGLTDDMRRAMSRPAVTRPRPGRLPPDVEDIGRQPTF